MSQAAFRLTRFCLIAVSLSFTAIPASVKAAPQPAAALHPSAPAEKSSAATLPSGQAGLATLIKPKAGQTWTEALYYNLSWKGIVGARFRLTARPAAKKEAVKLKLNPARPLLHISSRLKTESLVETVFPVNDHMESFWDTQSRQPLVTRKRLSEGFFRQNYFARFLHDKKLVAFNRRQYNGNTKEKGVKNPKARWSTKKKAYRINELTQDILSAAYFLRTLPELPADKKVIKVHVFDNGKARTIPLKATHRQTVSTAAGTFKCVRFIPLLKKGYYSKKGRLVVYVSDDSRRLPVRVVARAKYVGRLTADLVRFSDSRY